MIILCRPMLVSNIIVSQVLPHLHSCFSQTDISAIKSEPDRHKAVELLLDKLQASKEPGKWKMFVQALEECKYQTIVDALRRKGAADNNDPIKILHMFSPKLREMIVPSELTAELLKADVINSDDRSEIHQKERSAGAVAAADILLDRIPSKHPRWFDNFLEALRSVNRSDLADMLTGKDNTEYESTLPNVKQNPTTEVQAKTESTMFDVNKESRSNDHKNLEPLMDQLERFNPNDETIEKDILVEDRDLRSEKNIKSTPVVLHGQSRTVTDESERENVQPDTSLLHEQPNSGCLHCFCISKNKIESENIQKLKGRNRDLVIKTNDLELELKELEKILHAHKKYNEMQLQKRSLLEKIQVEEKKTADLKASISE
ncbi:uncharacterized protein LOC123558146 [Mercenaria mercenaria]|uniref:uncharacterized protein LOC123558146 n=1 Tax=Mercenaria mercenaria TaxID=6596 RepID=UPI00234E92A2|nr:uncharacterized protein LOC123558146 [Mercenaria mercenaria]